MRNIVTPHHFIISFLGLTIASAFLTAAPARADQRDFSIVNDSGSAITHLYVSNVATEDWEDDILGVGILEPDAKTQITFSKGVSGRCLYDIKVVSKGEDHVSTSINLCETTQIIFSGDQLVAR